jgi:hypothetical protein
VGNLGWNTPTVELEAKAWTMLKAAGFAEGEIVSLKTSYTGGPGSSVDVKFSSAIILQHISRSMGALRMIFRTDAKAKPAWLGVAKSRDELRPNQLVRRAADYLRDLELTKRQDLAREVEVEMRGKFVSIPGCGRIGCSVAGNWTWLPGAVTANFSHDELMMGKDWINDE